MLLAVYLTSITLLIGTPGPVVAFVLGVAARGGFRQALFTIMGTNWASLVLIATAALIISGLLSVSTELLAWISMAGCLFIAWLAVDGLRSDLAVAAVAAPADSYQAAPTLELAQQATSARSILRGFLVGISNPKDIVFFVAFFPQFIGITNQFQVSLAVLTALWVAFDFLILLCYATVINAGFFQRRKKLISLISSGFLLVIALLGAAYSLQEILG